ALLGLLVLAAVVWVALWIRPPQPARLIVLQAGYDTNLAVPVNPYGKAAARDLAQLAKPGGWFGDRSKLNGGTEPGRFARGPLLPDIENTRERCVVVVLAAHGGRDRDGAFLVPDDATADPGQRVRIKAILDRLAALPAKKQKLLILDATQSPAFPDLGLVHNDFAAALIDLEPDIRAVPNLVVFASTGPDERSWVSPEWGTSAFAHFLTDGLNGAADADGDKRIDGDELIGYVRPRVSDWARDHRAARQVPVVLPRDEGESRARAMHLTMTDGTKPTAAAPVPFDPPPEVEQAWQEYRELAAGTPPPQAYTPHIWREYEAWVLRFEQLILAGDEAGARAVRAKAADARRRIEAARPLDVTPQTLALPAALGGTRYYPEPPAAFREGIARVADPSLPATQRAAEWAKVKAVPGFDPAAARVQWVRVFILWVAEEPATRLPVVPEVVPLVIEGFTLRPAELHFLVMLASRQPPHDKLARLAPTLRAVLALRLHAEAHALGLAAEGYPYSEYIGRWIADTVVRGDVERRQAEDLCFATDEASWGRALRHAQAARLHYDRAAQIAAKVRRMVAGWQAAAHRFPGLREWLLRPPSETGLARELAFRGELRAWGEVHQAALFADLSPDGGLDEPRLGFDALGGRLTDHLARLDARLAADTADLLAVRPEFEGKVTPRPDAVRWLGRAEAVLTAPPADAVSSAARRDLLREYRRVSRQLQVTGQTNPEPLPEVTEPVTRERAFEAARRRGLSLLARVGQPDLNSLPPGEPFVQVEFRLNDFAARANGRASLAEAGSRLGEILAALSRDADQAGPNPAADRALRLITGHAAADARQNPAEQLRRAGVRGMLSYQAARTVLDHWYAENESRYYLRAAGQLRDDANRIFPLPNGQRDTFADLVRADDEPFPVEPVLPPRFVMTDEPEAELNVTFARKPDRSGRPGFPVFWADPPFTPPDATGAERTPYGTEPDAPPTPFTRTVRGPAGPKPVTPAAVPGKVQVGGFYRGRTITRGIDAAAYPT
ncbi:MAG: caspase family protein, partial [Gemmataceae bacterium]|nr:caspase family protein [Gemmataceae bacterium]